MCWALSLDCPYEQLYVNTLTLSKPQSITTSTRSHNSPTRSALQPQYMQLLPYTSTYEDTPAATAPIYKVSISSKPSNSHHHAMPNNSINRHDSKFMFPQHNNITSTNNLAQKPNVSIEQLKQHIIFSNKQLIAPTSSTKPDCTRKREEEVRATN